MGMTWEEYKAYREKKKKEEQQKAKSEKKQSSSNKTTNNINTSKESNISSSLTLNSNKNNLVSNASSLQDIINKNKNPLAKINSNPISKIVEEKTANSPLQKAIKERQNTPKTTQNEPSTWDRIMQNLGLGGKGGVYGVAQTGYRDIKDIDNAYTEASSLMRHNVLSTFFGEQGENVARGIDEKLYEWNYGRNKLYNYALDVLGQEQQKNSQAIQQNIEEVKKTGDKIGTKFAELTPSVGQNAIGMMATAVNPALGFTYYKMSSEASYYDDALNRGMTEEQAKLYSKLMSYVEAGTETLSASNIVKGGKTLKAVATGTKTAGIKVGLKAGFDVLKEEAKEESVNTIKKALKSYGVGILEEGFQEAITEPLQELTAMAVAGKDKADWSNIWQRMLQSGVDGALSSVILAGANAGVSSCQIVTTKLNNNQQITQQEYKKAVQDASEKIDVQKMITDQMKTEVNKVKNELQTQDNEVVDQQNKTSQNETSQVLDTTETLRQEARNKLESIKQNYDENSYNQMQEFIETAPSEKALNQVINDLNKEAETKQVAPLKQETQNKSFEDVAFEAMSNYESNEAESPLKNRDMDSIGKQTKVNAYQYDNPQVKPYFQEMAQQMGEDLAYISSSDNRSTQKGGGTKLSATTKAMDILHNEQGYSYNQIAQGLQNIIDDKGSENNAISKKIELVIDEQLRNGYTNALGRYVEPSQEYINTIQQNQKYSVEQPQIQEQEPVQKNIINKYKKNWDIKPYSQKDINHFNKSNNLIDGVNSDLKTFAEKFYDKNTRRAKEKKAPMKMQKLFLGRINDRISNYINSIINNSGRFDEKYDVTDSNIVISSNNVEHFYNDHGNEKRMEQIDVTPENIIKYPEVVSSPEYIGLSDNLSRGNTPVVYMAKKINGYSVAVEVITKHKQIYPEAYYIFKSNSTQWDEYIKNHNLKEVEDMGSNELNSSQEQNAQSDMPETSSNNSISQNEQNVKSDSTNINNMQNNQENIQETKLPMKEKQEVKAPIKQENTKIKFDNEVMKTNSEIKGNSETPEKIAKILSEPTKNVKPEQRTWAILKANFIDKGAVFEKISQKTNNRDLQGKYDYTLTAGARGQYAIGNDRYVYSNGKKTLQSKSLTSIMDEVGENTQAFNEYMYHQLNVDRMTLDERFGIENKPVFGESITADISRAEIAKIEEQHPEFKEYANDVYKYLEANKQELVDRGVISQETSDFFKERYPHYVPIQRATRKGNSIDVALDTKRTGINSPIKKAKGGNQDINPLFQTMASQTLQTYRASARNNFGLELKNTLQQMNQLNENRTIADIDDIVDTMTNEEQNNELLQPSKKGENPTFTVFEDGKKITYDISQDMYDALKPKSEILNKLDNTKLAKAGRKISNFRRGVLTEYNPIFSITNALKDAQDVLINSQHSAKTYAKFPEAYAQIVKKGYWYNEYIQNGGEQNSYFTEGDFENIKSSKLDKAKNVLKFPLEKISQVNNVIEMAPRLAEYIVSRQNGANIETAMLDASRVTTNFKAGGDITKFANRNGATFLNASIQGFQQQVRNIQEANMKGLKGWTNLALKYTVAGLPALLLNNLFWDDDDDYEQLQDYVKDNYYVIAKLPNGNFLRIPKGRMVATIQKVVSNANDFVKDGKINSDDVASTIWNDLKEDVSFGMDNLAPNNPIDNNILSPIIQVAQNKTWYGDDLVPQRLQDVPEEEQADETTDKFSKWLGEKLKVSPIKINYLLDQYSGGIGDVLLPLGTPQAENNVIEDKFTTDPVMKSQYPADFFNKRDELNVRNNSLKATDEDKLKYKYISSIQSNISDLYKQKREIQASDKTDKEKKAELKKVQKQINELARESLETVDKVEINGNGAKIGEQEYYKKNGTWTKLTEKEKGKLRNTSMSTYSSYQSQISGKDLKDYEKIQILRDSNYSNEEKSNLYEKTISTDKYYSTLKKSGIDIDEYMDYKLAQSNGDFTADKKNGKTVMGSGKKKVIKYLNNNITGYGNRLLIAGKQYSLSASQRKDLSNYINKTFTTQKERTEVYKQLKLNFVVNGNKVTYK